MADIEIRQLFSANGPVEQLQLDEQLQRHLLEYDCEKHVVTFQELIEVREGQPAYFENVLGRRASLVMMGPTKAGRI